MIIICGLLKMFLLVSGYEKTSLKNSMKVTSE
jgi:hypothetical protein